MLAVILTFVAAREGRYSRDWLSLMDLSIVLVSDYYSGHSDNQDMHVVDVIKKSLLYSNK